MSSSSNCQIGNVIYGKGPLSDFQFQYQLQPAERRLHLLSAKTRATPAEYYNQKHEQLTASHENKRTQAVSQSLACVNFANPNKKLAPQKSALNKKDRIFSAVTAKPAQKTKTFGGINNNYNYDPVSDSKGESSIQMANFNSDQLFGISGIDDNFEKLHQRHRSNNIMFAGLY